MEHFRSRTFRAKLQESLAIVAAALHEAERPYIAFSGGKDSVAVAALVHATEPSVQLAWSDDELEFPEHVEWMQQLSALAGHQLTVTAGWTEHAGWFRPWRSRQPWRDPLPCMVTINMPQDDWMASNGYDLVFTGLRMDENPKRRAWLAANGPIYSVQSGCGRRCCPLMHWTADDVWALITGWRLAYSPVYDRYDEIGIPRDVQRIGPLPLSPRQHLLDGWPEMLADLEARYGPRWV